MTHPFLFHPQVAPWFKESADTLLLTLFSELDAPSARCGCATSRTTRNIW